MKKILLVIILLFMSCVPEPVPDVVYEEITGINTDTGYDIVQDIIEF